LSADRLAEELDYEGFALPDGRAFVLLLTCWRMATQDKPFPLATLIQRRWSNVGGQIAFLRYATAAPPQVFSFEHAQNKLAPVEGLQGAKSPMGTPNQAWMSLDLLSTLTSLYEEGHVPAVRQILELPLSQCPDVLVLGLASARRWDNCTFCLNVNPVKDISQK
jgi:CCR4-NOT transcription complex subunit 1